MKEKKKTDVMKITKTNFKKPIFILNIKNITKTFLNGKIIANNNVTLDFEKGEIHSIVGENGSGKSTLMNILFGLYKQDKGKIFINGEQVDMSNAGSAKKHKIGMVHQHFHLIDAFTVLDNIILGQESIELDDEKKEELEKKLSSLTKEIEKTDQKKVKKIIDILDKLKWSKQEDVKSRNIWKEFSNEKNRLDQVKDAEKIPKFEKKLLILERIVEKNGLFLELVNSEYMEFCVGKNRELTKIIKSKIEKEIELNAPKLLGVFGKLNRKALLERFKIIQEKYNILLDPYAKVSTLSVGQRQMVEILKVLWEEKKILVFDEPTATLSISEIEKLITTISSLKEEGKTIIFISHKLQEVKAISDKISVLRKGVLVKTFSNKDSLNVDDISKLMVGKVIKLDYPERYVKPYYVFGVKNLSYKTTKGFMALNNISFSVKRGEIFGLAGIEGNGQEEVIEILTNMKTPTGGQVFYKKEILTDSKGYKLKSIERRKIMSYIPIDREKHGIIPNKDLQFNAKVSDFDTKYFNKENELTIKDFTKKIVDDFKVEGAFKNSVEIRNLSGGNQQKFVVGREMLREHEILIAGHPTRGLDILAIDNIYKKMLLNSENKTTILYSLEITELFAICDRMAIMYKGKIVGIVNPKNTSLETISKMMTGKVK